ncbi:MAG: hypothetical protein PHT43_07625 [Anaerolineaceae bacterium]|nr:hypothetical protein [Anaerolineaceae bacterium]
MKNIRINLFCTLGLIPLCIAVGTAQADSVPAKTDVATSAQSLTAATTKEEREEHVIKLMSQYAQVERILLQNLHDSCSRDIKDNTYYSPLHAAIFAVSNWRIAQADDALIEVIDYTLDQTSLPDGISVFGDYFYPAIRPLVVLRVDVRKVIKAIAQAENEKRISLLSWVLAERLGSDLPKATEHLKAEIERRKDSQEKKNLSLAIERIGQAEHSSDLLPLACRDQVKSMPLLDYILRTGKLWGICEMAINDAEGTVTLAVPRYTGRGLKMTLYDNENKRVEQVTLKVNQHCLLSDNRHSFMKYLIKSIKDGIVEVEVTEHFDARSFGKEVTEQTETMAVKAYQDTDTTPDSTDSK